MCDFPCKEIGLLFIFLHDHSSPHLDSKEIEFLGKNEIL